jgi:hypothetical protein
MSAFNGGMPFATDTQARAQASASTVLSPSNLAARASFSANKNAVAQTGIADNTLTKVTFTNEDFDTGGFYDATNSLWTPPVGGIRISASVLVTGTLSAAASFTLAVYKNSAVYKVFRGINGATETGCTGTAIDIANGSDYYEIYILVRTSAGTGTVSGSVVSSFFQGEQI